MTGARAAAAAAMALALGVLAGCSGGGDGDAADAVGSTTAPPAAAGCPPLPLAGNVVDSTTVVGDFDGDARPDRLQAYRAGAGEPWRLRVEPAAGGATETELPAAAAGVKAVGGARLDPSPAETAFAVVGTNAFGVDLGLFLLRSCRLERVTLRGAAATFPVGAGAGGGARGGLACQPPGLVVLSATSTDGGVFFRGSSVAYLLLVTELDEINRSASNLTADDPLLARYGAFSCGSLRL